MVATFGDINTGQPASQPTQRIYLHHTSKEKASSGFKSSSLPTAQVTT